MQTLLTIIPIAVLLLCLVVFKLSVTKSGGIAMGLALVLSVVFFKISAYGLMVASGKALWVGLFVSLIVWNALFLYHLVSDFGAIEVINAALMKVLKDKFVAFLLLAWLFTGLLQGIAGFGIPSVIVAPILIALGFNPVKSVTASLLGHSWSIPFGSMGASFFVISGITGIEQTELGFPVWVLNMVTITMTGIFVCFVYDGFKGVAKGLTYIIPVVAAMSGMQYLTIHLGMYSLGTINTALAGVTTMFLLYKIRSRLSRSKTEQSGAGSGASISQESETETTTDVLQTKPKLTILQSVFPYALILLLLLSFQFIPATVRDLVAIAPNFPATSTALDYSVRAETNYNPIKLFIHPAMVLLIAAGVACAIYKKTKVWDSGIFKGAVKKTVKKGVPATLALLAFGHMSLFMMDSGMMTKLAESVADITGNFYPLFAPYIGLLGTFLTGNNTNSSVMFGGFQQAVALRLELNPAVMSAAQVITGGLGCSIAPTLVFMAALATKQTEKVSVVLRKLIPIALIISAVMGITNFIFINNFA